MGEAKRRKGTQDAKAHEFVTASYAPATTTYVMDGGGEEFVHQADVRDFFTALRTPNAMRPSGWHADGPEAVAEKRARLGKALVGIDGAVVDRDGNILRVLTEEDVDVPHATIHFGVAGDVEPTGEPFDLKASLADGFLDADGSPVPDVRVRLSGLVRLGADGATLVAADLPLSVQATVLAGLIARYGGYDDPAMAQGVYMHLRHVACLATLFLREGLDDPLAWLDLTECEDLLASYAGLPFFEMPYEDPIHVSMALVESMDGARRTEPMWTLGPTIGLPDWQWTSRDIPGAGIIFASLEERLSRPRWSGSFPPPNADAQHLDVEGESLTRTRAILSRCRQVASNGADRVYLDEGRGLHLALLDHEGHKELVAWPLQAGPGDRSDPLMTEQLHDVLTRQDPPFAAMEARLADPRLRDGLDTLQSLGLLDALPSPFPEYEGIAFVHAHRRGLGIADFLASLAGTIEAGLADDAFTDAEDDDGPYAEDEDDAPDDTEADAVAKARAVAACRMHGGSPDPALKAMLDGVEDWEGIDIEGDLRMLRDAMSVGCNLLDMAIVAYGLLELTEDEA